MTINDVRLLLISTLVVAVALTADAADSLPDRIAAAQRSSNFAQAAALYRELIASGTDTPEVRSNCGLMLHLAGKNREALEQFQAALRKSPDLTAANLFAGISESELGAFRAALPYLTKAEQLEPDKPAPYLALGKVYVAMREYGRAIDVFAKAVAMDAQLAEGWYGLGVADRSLADQILNQAARNGNVNTDETKKKVDGLLGQATDALTRAVNLEPNSARTHLLMAESLADQGKLADSASEYQTALRIDPGLSAATLGLATQYWKQRQFDEALPLLNRFLSNNPNDAEANGMVADILEHNGDLAEAERHARKALQIKPDLIQTRTVLARIYLAKGEPKPAIDELQKVLAADTDGSYHFLLYRACRAAGQEQAAKEAMAEFQRLRHGTPE